MLCPQIYPDPELEVQVLGLPIRCIHSEEGCRWSGPLRHLQVRLWAGELGPALTGRVLTEPLPSGTLEHLQLQCSPLPQSLSSQAEPA